VNVNTAGIGTKESKNQLEDDGLTGAAGAKHDAHAAGWNDEADVAEDDVIVEGKRDVLEDYRWGSQGVRLGHVDIMNGEPAVHKPSPGETSGRR
jgi:hypothetical protein